MKYPPKQIGLRHIDWVSLALSTEMPTISKALIMYLARFMNRDQDIAWPSQARMMTELSISKGSLHNHLNLLESEGWIIRHRGNSQSNTRYLISFPELILKKVHQMTNSSGDELRSSGDELGVVQEMNTNRILNSKSNSKSIGESKKTASTVPYQKIVDLYHEILPNNPHIAKLNESRRRQIKARHLNNVETLEDWREYFEIVAESKFLTGQCPAGYNRSKPFIADIDFLIKEINLLKIIEGKYHE